AEAITSSHAVTEPGQLGEEVARALLGEVDCGGVVDRQHQWLAALFMSMAADHKVSTVVFGQELTPYTIAMLRNIRDFMGVVFKFNSQQVEEEVVLDEESDEKEMALSRSVSSKKGQKLSKSVAVSSTFTMFYCDEKVPLRTVSPPPVLIAVWSAARLAGNVVKIEEFVICSDYAYGHILSTKGTRRLRGKAWR
ncbi:rRNA-processing endoribonuclease, partial [Perkinsus olseni]